MPTEQQPTGKQLTKSPLGESGRTVAENVNRLKDARNLSFATLSRKLEDIGRPIPTLGLRKIVAHTRRVDVDDLVALAVALGVSPATLLMPHVETARDDVAVTGRRDPVSADRAWAWFGQASPLFEVEPEDQAAFIFNAWPSWRFREYAEDVLKEAGVWRQEKAVDGDD